MLTCQLNSKRTSTIQLVWKGISHPKGRALGEERGFDQKSLGSVWDQHLAMNKKLYGSYKQWIIHVVEKLVFSEFPYQGCHGYTFHKLGFLSKLYVWFSHLRLPVRMKEN